MRILQISNKIPFIAKDGGTLATLNLILGLSEYSIVDILTMNTKKHFVSEQEIKARSPKNVHVDAVDVDTGLNPLHMFLNLFFSKKPYILKRFEIKAFEVRLKEILSRNYYHLVQLEGLYLSSYIDIIRKHTAAKIVYRSHNVESQIWFNNARYTKGFLKKWYLRNMAIRLKSYERNLVNKYDLLVPISPIDLTFFEENKNNKPYFIAPFTVNTANYLQKENQVTSPVKLFYIGALDWIPNIEGLKWFLKNVWQPLSDQNSNIKFVVAGRNADKSLEDFLKNYKVDYLGEVNQSSELFLNNQVMIVPLFAGSGMRVKIIEGMAYGKTIIATTKAAEGIQYKNKQNVFIADSAQDFMETINMLVKDMGLTAEIGKSARSLVEQNYNSQLVCKGLAEFYQQNI